MENKINHLQAINVLNTFCTRQDEGIQKNGVKIL